MARAGRLLELQARVVVLHLSDLSDVRRRLQGCILALLSSLASGRHSLGSVQQQPQGCGFQGF